MRFLNAFYDCSIGKQQHTVDGRSITFLFIKIILTLYYDCNGLSGELHFIYKILSILKKGKYMCRVYCIMPMYLYSLRLLV